MENEQEIAGGKTVSLLNAATLDALIMCQIDVIKGIQNGEKAMSARERMESIGIGIKSLRDLIDIKHSLESNRPADIAQHLTFYASHEGESIGIVRSLEKVLQRFKGVNPV